MVNSHCADVLKNNILKKRQAKVIQNDMGDDGGFVYADITFLAGSEDVEPAKLCGQYDYLIVDFGQADCVGEYELKMCDRLFLIGDLSLGSFEGSIRAADILGRRYAGKICFMCVFYCKDGISEYRRAAKEPVIIPVDMEPFAISRDTILLMEKLFGEEAYGIGCKMKN